MGVRAPFLHGKGVLIWELTNLKKRCILVVEGRKGIKDYKSFLSDLQDELFMAVANCENVNWHHALSYTPEWKHYMRLLTWLDEVNERVGWYNDHKKTPIQTRLQSSQETGGVVRQQCEPDGDDGEHTEYR